MMHRERTTEGLAYLVSAAIALISMTGCGDTLFYGERTGFNLSISVDAAQERPLEVNGGFARQVVGIVPAVGQPSDDGRPDGEAVDMFSRFQLRYDEDDQNVFRGTLTVRSAFASGEAAREVAKLGGPAAKIVLGAISGIPAVNLDLLSTQAAYCRAYDPSDTRWHQVEIAIGTSMQEFCGANPTKDDLDKLKTAAKAAGITVQEQS